MCFSPSLFPLTKTYCRRIEITDRRVLSGFVCRCSFALDNELCVLTHSFVSSYYLASLIENMIVLCSSQLRRAKVKWIAEIWGYSNVIRGARNMRSDDCRMCKQVQFNHIIETTHQEAKPRVPISQIPKCHHVPGWSHVPRCTYISRSLNVTTSPGSKMSPHPWIIDVPTCQDHRCPLIPGS